MKGVKKKKKILKGEEMRKVTQLIKFNVFKLYTKTESSLFYRCILCRVGKIRTDCDSKTLVKVKGHSPDCKYRRIKPEEFQEEEGEVELNSCNDDDLVGSNNEVDEAIKEIEERGKNLKIDLQGVFSKFSIFGNDSNIYARNRSNICVFKIAKVTEQEIITFQNSFNFALKSKNFKFCDDLIFIKGTLTLQNSLQIQTISDENEGVIKSFKMKSRQKIYGPLIIDKDPLQGFIVKAINNIPALSLICEYSGSVVKYDPDEMKNEDSLMEYCSSDNDDYVISPNKYCNVARFISGVNNLNPKGREGS
jgi:hypothetical protein